MNDQRDWYEFIPPPRYFLRALARDVEQLVAVDPSWSVVAHDFSPSVGPLVLLERASADR